MTKDKEHLPFMGVGPIYVVGIMILTTIGVVLEKMGYIKVIGIRGFSIELLIIGLLLIGFGVFMWQQALFTSDLDFNIRNNHLVTTGIYGRVRNPIYSAALFICTGVLVMCNNLILLILPIIFWGILTVLMINTEEKWLENLYGEEYRNYKRNVNRCIPWRNKGMN